MDGHRHGVILAALWRDLKAEGLLAGNVPVPA